MRSNSLWSERPAGRLRAAVLLGAPMLAALAALGACSDDRPVEPPAPASATTPSTLRFISTEALIWKVVDLNTKALLPGAVFEVVGGPFKTKWTVADNSPQDAEPIVGKFRLASLAAGTYTVCQIGAPWGWANASCAVATVTVNGTNDAGAFEDPLLPRLWTEYVDYGKNLVGGGSISLTDSLGFTTWTIVDNGIYDTDKTDGKFKVILPLAGTYKLCEVTPPPGYVFPGAQTPPCTTVSLPNNNMALHTGPFTVNPPYSATWAVIDGFHDPFNKPGWIGPSSFVVTKPDGSLVLKAVDNVANDTHLMMGIYHVKLPAAGSYIVCQVDPVPGHWLPTPKCHTVNVTLGIVGWGDYFINPEAQVPSP